MGACDQDLALSRSDDLEELVTLGELLGALHVVLIELEEDVPQGLLHGIHEILEPLLNTSLYEDALAQLDNLLLLRDELSDVVSLGDPAALRGKAQRVGAFEDLLDVLLNGLGVLGLADDLEQVVIREEVEAGEEATLALKELVQVLLDVLQLAVQLLQDIDEALDNKGAVRVLLLVDALHLLLEVGVDLGEDRALARQLLGDVLLPAEDALKVAPLALDGEKELEGLSDLSDVVLPAIDLVVELLVVG